VRVRNAPRSIRDERSLVVDCPPMASGLPIVAPAELGTLSL